MGIGRSVFYRESLFTKYPVYWTRNLAFKNQKKSRDRDFEKVLCVKFDI